MFGGLNLMLLFYFLTRKMDSFSQVNQRIKLPRIHIKMYLLQNLPLKYSRIELMEFIAHESFHLIQDKLKIPASNPSLPHLSTIEGRTLLHVEIIELFKALKESQAQRRNFHIKNALALRTARYAQFPDAMHLESKCEMNEGLAEYTGRIYAGYSTGHLMDEYEKDIVFLESISYPYISGSLYAFLNDKSGKKWKNQLPEKSVSQLNAFLYDVLINDGYNELVDSLLKVDDYKEYPSKFSTFSVDGLEKTFSKNILVIPSKGSQFQFKSNVVVSIPNKGTVYNNIIITNEWGSLEVDINGRVLISDNISLNSDSLSFEYNQVKGKHWALKLAPLWEVVENNGTYILQKHN